jgi:hypothetical protein
MQYLSIPIAAFASCEFVGEDPVNRATWVTLLAYCAQVENGGRICGCLQWGDRRWQQSCKVTKEEVNRPSALIRWEGNDLVISCYPSAKESEIQAKRAAGIERAALRWNTTQKNHKTAHSSATSSAHSSAIQSATSSPDAYGKVREGKVREGKGKGGPGDSSLAVKPLDVECAAAAAPTAKAPEIKTPKPKAPPLDDDWLQSIADDPAYFGLDVKQERNRMIRWCEVNHKHPSRKRLINWLNRCERPMAFAQPPTAPNPVVERNETVWAITKRIEVIETQMSDLKLKGGMEAAFGFEWSDQKRKGNGWN